MFVSVLSAQFKSKLCGNFLISKETVKLRKHIHKAKEYCECKKQLTNQAVATVTYVSILAQRTRENRILSFSKSERHMLV